MKLEIIKDKDFSILLTINENLVYKLNDDIVVQVDKNEIKIIKNGKVLLSGIYDSL